MCNVVKGIVLVVCLMLMVVMVVGWLECVLLYVVVYDVGSCVNEWMCCEFVVVLVGVWIVMFMCG